VRADTTAIGIADHARMPLIASIPRASCTNRNSALTPERRSEKVQLMARFQKHYRREYFLAAN
jgi:hypothetical protein